MASDLKKPLEDYCPPPTPGEQAGNKKRETDKQSIKFKEEAIICCKERKITSPTNEWRNIPFYHQSSTSSKPPKV